MSTPKIGPASPLNGGHRPMSAGSSCTTETWAITPSRGPGPPSTPTVPWIEVNGEEAERHPPSQPRRHSPPGRISEDLENQLEMTARALAVARSKLDDEKHKALTARKAEGTQRALAAEARADAERAWQSAWHSAEQQRIKREQELASRLQLDRRKLDERLWAEAAEQAAELERRVAIEVEARETQLPHLKVEVDRRGRGR